MHNWHVFPGRSLSRSHSLGASRAQTKTRMPTINRALTLTLTLTLTITLTQNLALALAVTLTRRKFLIRLQVLEFTESGVA